MLAPCPSQLNIPKPQGFKPAGRIKSASQVAMKRRILHDPTIARYKKGVRYEKKAIKYLEPLLSPLGKFIHEPCFRYDNGRVTRFCFPDVLVLLSSCPFNLLIEIKTRHTYSAWWQLRHLYEPVVAKALNCNLRLLEMVAAYDPGVKLPEETLILDKLEDVLKSNHPYNLYIWSGR